MAVSSNIMTETVFQTPIGSGLAARTTCSSPSILTPKESLP